MVLILFFLSELDLDLKGLDSRAWKGGLYDEVYCGISLYLEFERDLYLGLDSRLYADLYEDLYSERFERAMSPMPGSYPVYYRVRIYSVHKMPIKLKINIHQQTVIVLNFVVTYLHTYTH